MKTLSALAFAALATAAASGAVTTPGVEISAFGAPALGNDFKDHTGFGVSGAVTAAYAFPDSAYGEQFLGQLEGIYLHGSGTNTIGGPSHRESLDAGFGMLNFGLGTANDHWAFTIFAGLGFGGGSLSGDTTAKDLSLDAAFQLKPRVTWRFARAWSVFAEYRYFRTASVFGDLFSNDDGRRLSMHAIGLGVSYSF